MENPETGHLYYTSSMCLGFPRLSANIANIILLSKRGAIFPINKKIVKKQQDCK